LVIKNQKQIRGTILPLISVITPFSRGVKELAQLIRDFRNQTFKNFEHLIVNYGPAPDDVKNFIKEHEKDYNIRFSSVEKNMALMSQIPRSPGVGPRIYGTSKAISPFVYYADDDNRVKDSLLEVLLQGMTESRISVVQVACAESRIKRNGSPTKIAIIPEIGLPTFPMVCHIDTACFLVPRKWALKDPWKYDGNTGDFTFLKRIIERNKPEIVMNNGVQADLDGLFTRGIRDWVSIPPFYRN
jgi:glycosyltransferase involved in cell wall biosynthesis